MADIIPPKAETVIRAFHPSFWNYWGWYLAAVLCMLTIIGFLLGVIIVIWAELERRSTTYTITDRRVIKEVGILGKSTTSTIYQKITDVRTSQSFVQSILGIGNIAVNTAGGEGPELVMRGIGDMPGVKRLIEDAWSGVRT